MAARGEPICERDDCSPFDIGLVYKDIGGFTAEEKFRFIENIWKPGEIFDFPSTVENGKSRKFVCAWAKKYPWLVYSKYLDGAFCLPCVCFGVRFGSNACKLNKLYKSPLTRWTSGSDRLAAHSNGKSDVHNFAVTAMQNFLTVMRRAGGAVPIDEQMNEALRQRIARNREILKSLFSLNLKLTDSRQVV